MNKPSIPFQTFGLVLLLLGIHFLVPDKNVFYFSAENISQGETWRLLTGHLVHADLQHLGWNCLGLLVLGSLIEQYSKTAWWKALFAGIAAVNTLLLSPFAQLDNYCGLSGVLNSLLLVVLWYEWLRTHSWLVVFITMGAVAKTLIEVASGESLLTHIDWPPFAWSHVAGLIGGMLVVLAQWSCPKNRRPPQRPVCYSQINPQTLSTMSRHAWSNSWSQQPGSMSQIWSTQE